MMREISRDELRHDLLEHQRLAINHLAEALSDATLLANLDEGDEAAIEQHRMDIEKQYGNWVETAPDESANTIIVPAQGMIEEEAAITE